MLLSVDGLHESDLARYIGTKPDSTLAKLARAGTHFTDVTAPFPSDSFPSVLAWATGGTPRSTGVFYDISYDRSLSAPGSDCSVRGTRVDFSEVADLDSTRLDGGNQLNPAALPRDPDKNCAGVFPHDYLRVNTIFEVVKAAGLRTAWSDKHLTYEVLNGPSGAGVDDLFDPEIAAISSKVLSEVQTYDQSKVDALKNQIHGQDHAGNASRVPALFGMNFQAVSTVQKNVQYLDANGTPDDPLLAALDGVDAQIGSLVDALNESKLWGSTALLVTASHGQSPIDPAKLRRLPASLIPGLVAEVSPGLLASATEDAVALLWLNDATKTEAVKQHLLENQEAAGIDQVLAGAELLEKFGDPAADSRVPDLVVVVKDGVIYTDSKKKVAEHGGMSDDDRKVTLLVVGGSTSAQVVDQPVETRQIAPTILEALALDPKMLKALASEPIDALPGLNFPHQP